MGVGKDAAHFNLNTPIVVVPKNRLTIATVPVAVARPPSSADRSPIARFLPGMDSEDHDNWSVTARQMGHLRSGTRFGLRFFTCILNGDGDDPSIAWGRLQFLAHDLVGRG